MNTHVLNNPFLGQEVFGGVLECTADQVGLTVSISKHAENFKISKFGKCVFIWQKKERKKERKCPGRILKSLKRALSLEKSVSPERTRLSGLQLLPNLMSSWVWSKAFPN